MMKSKLMASSRFLLFLTGILIFISRFVPIWYIDLDAPQYPEGLQLKIMADGLGGNVDIINGLNHYIGMKTLHNEDFIEFTILPWLIIAFAAGAIITALIARFNGLLIYFVAFLSFGVVAMIDFWRWEYNYGHNLDPNAAIIVPGMAYQPPLIGFKQLLNFGAYSMPDIGGWLFIVSGILVLGVLILEIRNRKKIRKISVLAFLLSLGFVSCSQQGPVPIQLNKDVCENCKMTISHSNFGAELKNKHGKVYFFDDLSCLLMYQKINSQQTWKEIYVHDYLKENQLTDATRAWYVRHESIKSPMNGQYAAFSDKKDAEQFSHNLNSPVLVWKEIN